MNASTATVVARPIATVQAGIARHLWRMCFAMLLATSAFFPGQTQVFPAPIRSLPLLSIPVLVVLVTMICWMWRMRSGRRLDA